MALFRYEATDQAGSVVRGVMTAQDEQQVARKLAAMGYSPRGIYLGAATTSAAQAPRRARVRAATSALGVPVSVESRVPVSRLAIFFRQLATLVRSGIPLHQAFSDLAVTARERRIKRAIAHIQRSLQAGQTLSSAMTAHPDVFPAHAVAAVWCGELAGRLDLALNEIATDLELEASDRRIGRFGWALVKINLVFLIVTLPFYNISALVRPVLGDALQDVQQSGQLVEAFWRGVLDSMVRKSLPVALALIVLWIVWGQIKRVPAVRRLMDAALLRVPIWGRLHRYRSASRFLRALEMLYSAGVSPWQAWQAASVTPRNSEIAAKLRQAREISSQSAQVTDLAAAANVLEPDEVSLISAGERSGDLPATLARLQAAYVDRAAAQKSVGRLLSVSLMNAALIAMTGAAVIILVKSYLGPIMKFMGV